MTAIDIKKNLRENKGLWIFVGIALVVAVLLGVFVSPWASSSPDGLERIAVDKGFMKKAEEKKPAWEHSPMKDYAFPGVKSEKASTGVSGLVGVLITLAVATAVGLLALGLNRLHKKRMSSEGSPDAP
ncbi:MAG: PDGLE domain-containing protein [Actinobacteria bacterium]|nr:PDGLE domain-containing protein [Actinomycetota bacterium]